MRKAAYLWVLMLVIPCIYVNAASTEISFQEDIRVSFVNQEPDPAEPGKYIEIRLKFENYGSEMSGNIKVEALPAYPFTIEPGEDAVKDIGTLQARQKGDAGIIVKYKLRVDKNAVEGTNTLKFRYMIGDSGWITPEDYEIQIRTHDAILNVKSVTAEPETVSPGSTTKVKISVENIADSYVKDVRAKLNLGSMPFATLKSSDEKTIKIIGSGDTQAFEFSLICQPGAVPNLYRMPVDITYLDELGNRYNRSVSFGISVGGRPDLSVILESSNIYRPGNKGDLSVKFVNKGLNDIKFLNVKLGSGQFTLLSPSEAYIGNIDSDDYETADFTLFVKENSGNRVLIPLDITYMDTNNNQYSEKRDIYLELYNAADAKKLGLVKESGSIGILIILAVVAVGVFAYLVIRKKRKGK